MLDVERDVAAHAHMPKRRSDAPQRDRGYALRGGGRLQRSSVGQVVGITAHARMVRGSYGSARALSSARGRPRRSYSTRSQAQPTGAGEMRASPGNGKW